MAWLVWTQMQATGWQFLPLSGGLMDQPELLMRNLYILSSQYQELMKPNG